MDSALFERFKLLSQERVEEMESEGRRTRHYSIGMNQSQAWIDHKRTLTAGSSGASIAMHGSTVLAGRFSMSNLLVTLLISIRTFPRTKGVKSWEKETHRPVIGNLATHSKKHEEKIASATSSEPPTVHSSHGFTAASAKLMEGYLKEGALNPRLVPSQSGFLKMFAAWLLEDDLAWTTSEPPGLGCLFKYMQVNFKLPSDTTVRNTVAQICQDLHKNIVEELVVSSLCSHFECGFTNVLYSFRGSSRKYRTCKTPGLQSKWSFRSVAL